MTHEIPYRLVSIVWRDAKCESGWSVPDAIEGPVACVSVGWLVRDDDQWVGLAATIGGDEVNQTMAIPKPWIDEMKDLV